MKKAAPRIVFLLIAVVLACSSISGCRATNKNLSGLGIKNNELTPATLKFYFMGEERIDTRVVLDAIEKRAASTLNIKLDFKWIPNREYKDKIINLLTSGEPFDAFYVNSGFEMLAKEIITKGYSPDQLLADITDLFPKNAPSLYSSFGEEIKQASYNGKLVMVPHYLNGSSRMCAIVRQDLVEKYNIPEIKTYDDYEVYLKTIKENEKSIIPAVTVYGINGEAYGYSYLNYEIYYKWDDPEMTLIPWEITLEFKKAIEMQKRWNDNGYIYKGSEDYEALLSSGKVSAFTAPWEEAYIWAQTLGKNQKFKVYPLNMDQAASRIPFTSSAMAFSNSSMNIERALNFMEWIESSQENYDLLIYGIEGTHYTLNNGRISFPADETSYYGWNGSDAFFNFNFIHESASTDYNYKELYTKMVETNTKYPPAAGFAPDESSIKDLVNNRRSLVAMEQDVIDGRMTVEELINEQKTMGIDEMIYNLQMQLNSWRTEKINNN